MSRKLQGGGVVREAVAWKLGGGWCWGKLDRMDIVRELRSDG